MFCSETKYTYLIVTPFPGFILDFAYFIQKYRGFFNSYKSNINTLDKAFRGSDATHRGKQKYVRVIKNTNDVESRKCLAFALHGRAAHSRAASHSHMK